MFCSSGVTFGCLPGDMSVAARPVESAILAVEGAFSGVIAGSILAPHPASFVALERQPDIQ